MTSKHENSRKAKPKLSPPDSPVRTSACVAKVPDLPESVRDSSGRLCEPFAWYDRHTCCWRTWQRCLIEGWARYSAALAKRGYDAEWDSIQAAAVSLPHGRDRVWITAYSHGERIQGLDVPQPLLPYSEESRRREFARAVDAALPANDYARMRGNHDGVSDIMDRLRALGNAVVPQIPEIIGRAILQVEAG